MQYSEEQKNIFKAILNQFGPKHYIVTAAAGCGKTTTIIGAIEAIYQRNSNAKIIFVTFNRNAKDVALNKANENDTLRRALTDGNLIIATYHSAAMRLLQRHGVLGKEFHEGKEWIETKYKTYISQHVVELAGGESELARLKKVEQDVYLHNLLRNINLVRNNLLNSPKKIEKYLIDRGVGLVLNEPEALMNVMEWGKAKENQGTVDMCDLIWYTSTEKIMPAMYETYDYVFVDEGQDTAPFQRDFVVKYVKKRGGRLVVFGDTNQTINQWCGVLPTALEDFRDKTDLDEDDFGTLELNGSYRCPEAIVQEAVSIIPSAGIYTNVTDRKGAVNHDMSIDSALPGDMILARYRSIVMKVYLNLIKEEKNPLLLGRKSEEMEEIAGWTHDKAFDGVNDIAFNFSKQGIIPQLYMGLLTKIRKTMEQKHIDWDTAFTEDSIINAYDAIATIEALCDNIETRDELIERLEGLRYTVDRRSNEDLAKMSDVRQTSILCSTIHKAKGDEAANVYIVGKDILGEKNPRAKTEAEKLEEINLYYVAVTRASNTLNYVAKDRKYSFKTCLADYMAGIEQLVCALYGTEPINKQSAADIILSGGTI